MTQMYAQNKCALNSQLVPCALNVRSMCAQFVRSILMHHLFDAAAIAMRQCVHGQWRAATDRHVEQIEPHFLRTIGRTANGCVATTTTT